MQDLTDFEQKVKKLKKSTFAHKLAKLVKSCINSWMDLQVNLSELIVAHLIYMNPKFHSHSCFIQWDIGFLLKSIKILKSQVVATLPLGECLFLRINKGKLEVTHFYLNGI